MDASSRCLPAAARGVSREGKICLAIVVVVTISKWSVRLFDNGHVTRLSTLLCHAPSVAISVSYFVRCRRMSSSSSFRSVTAAGFG
jgi:hypothetical protein